MKEARIISAEDYDHCYYYVEIKNSDNSWQVCESYIIDDELVSVNLITLILSLIMQGYIIYDER